MRQARYQATVRSQALARNAAQDGVLGAALGLLLVSGLVASNLSLQQSMFQSHAPLASLATLVVAVVLQGAVIAGLGGAIVRGFSSND